jgi:hypothetical protein
LRGKWRTRVIISNWARLHNAAQLISPWFFKWVSITAHDRHLRRQVVVEAALTGRLAAMEREKADAASAGPERIAKGGDQRAVQMAKLEVELRRSESRVAGFSQQVRRLEEELLAVRGAKRERSSSDLQRQLSSRASRSRYFRSLLRTQALLECFRLWQIVVKAQSNLRQAVYNSKSEDIVKLEPKRATAILSLANVFEGTATIPAGRRRTVGGSLAVRYSPLARLLMLRCLSAWKQANVQAYANERFEDVEDESHRLIRLVEAAALRYDDLRLVRQVFSEWAHRKS